MDWLYDKAFALVLESERNDRRNVIDSKIGSGTKIFRLLKASGVDWSDDQLSWSKLLIFFDSMHMASANKIVGFFNTIGIDIYQFDKFGHNLLTAITNSETVPSTFYDSIPWDVYHLKTFLEFEVDPNNRTVGEQNSLHCVIQRHKFNLRYSIHKNDEDFRDDETFRGGEDRGEGSDWEDQKDWYEYRVRRYYKRRFGKCERDVIHDAFLEKARLLIEAGCDVHARDDQGCTPSGLVQRCFSDEPSSHSIL